MADFVRGTNLYSPDGAKYYVAESMWMIIDEFMTQKAGKYSQFVNSVTVTTLPCIIVSW